MKDAWFIQQSDEIVGPLPFERIRTLCREGIAKPETPVRDGEYGQWLRAERVPGLFPRPKPASAAPPDRDWLPGVVAVLGFAGLLALSLVVLNRRSNNMVRGNQERVTRETAERNVSLAMERAERWMASDGTNQFEFSQIERALKLAELEPCEKAKEVPELSRTFLLMRQKYAEDQKADAKYLLAVRFLDQMQVPQCQGLLKDYEDGKYGTRKNDARRLLEQIESAQSLEGNRAALESLATPEFDKFILDGVMPALPTVHPALADVRKTVWNQLRNTVEEKRKLNAERANKAMGNDKPLFLKSENPLMLLHPDTTSVAIFRIGDLLSNPTFLRMVRADPLGNALELGKQLSELCAGFGVNGLRDLDQLAIGFIDTDFKFTRGSIVLTGNFDAVKVHEGIRKEAARNGYKLNLRQHDGHTIFETTAPDGSLPCAVVLGGKHIVAATDFSTLKSILDGKREGPKRAIDLLAGVEPGTILCLSIDLMAKWYRDSLDTNGNIDEEMRKLLRLCEYARLEIAFDRGITFTGKIKMRDPDAVKAFAEVLLPLVDQVKGLAPLMAAQLGPQFKNIVQDFVTSLKLESKDDKIIVTFRLREEAFAR